MSSDMIRNRKHLGPDSRQDTLVACNELQRFLIKAKIFLHQQQKFCKEHHSRTNEKVLR